MTAAVRATRWRMAPRQPVEGVKNIIAVGAGKGGVGKTTMTVNLAAALARAAAASRFSTATSTGRTCRSCWASRPSARRPTARRSCPPRSSACRSSRSGFSPTTTAPIIWRGPMLHGTIQQFFREVRWTRHRLSLRRHAAGNGRRGVEPGQSVPVAGAVLVTTPQTVSVADTRRAIHMYRKLNIPTLG